MLSWLIPIAIDIIDATPLEDATVIGIPALAILEAIIIYSETGSKKWALFGLVESLIPVVDMIPGATLAKILGPKRY